MAEKDKLFSSKIKNEGVFSFKDFYKFCYDWLKDETGLLLSEDKYKEKLSGDEKKIEIEWTGIRHVSDYFDFEIKIEFKILGLKEIEITEGNKKIKTNKGSVEVEVKGTLVRDPKGKFERDGFQKFLRGLYEKMVIHSRIDQMEEKLIEDCEKFLEQAKAYLDLEGKK
jgi:hypothetical protein